MKAILLLSLLFFIGTANAQKIAVSPPMIVFEDSIEQEFTIINSNSFEIRYEIEPLDRDWFTFRNREGIVDANSKENVRVLLRNLNKIPKAATKANIMLRTFQDEENGFVINPGIMIKAKIQVGKMDYNAVVSNQKTARKTDTDVVVKKVSPRVNLWLIGALLFLIALVVVGMILVKKLK